ncbi:hypothetical protein PoB_002652100 [Plakobranchus ocellatus]|uniref:Uncharacterized protein n=1 Tax=Plakobranchus ocellatus TaxID=259542 RepID=A0AAV3ZZR5_9GAST|nr:hypothetical protein PoB_002652100 [Plakobranchus ocellatus]
MEYEEKQMEERNRKVEEKKTGEKRRRREQDIIHCISSNPHRNNQGSHSYTDSNPKRRGIADAEASESLLVSSDIFLGRVGFEFAVDMMA